MAVVLGDGLFDPREPGDLDLRNARARRRPAGARSTALDGERDEQDEQRAQPHSSGIRP